MEEIIVRLFRISMNYSHREVCIIGHHLTNIWSIIALSIVLSIHSNPTNNPALIPSLSVSKDHFFLMFVHRMRRS